MHLVYLVCFYIWNSIRKKEEEEAEFKRSPSVCLSITVSVFYVGLKLKGTKCLLFISTCHVWWWCVCCVNTNEKCQQRYSCFLKEKKKPQKNKTYIVEVFFCGWWLSLPFRRQDVPISDKSQNYAARRWCPHELINLLAPDEKTWFELNAVFVFSEKHCGLNNLSVGLCAK